jgi:hypothetical protein
MALATYTVNGTRLSVDMKAPLAEAQRLVSLDPLTKGIVLTPIRGFGSYSDNKASGSTDTGSGHVDFNAEGMTDAQAQRCVLYLRRVGFEAYFRPRSWWSSWLGRLRKPGWQRHIHCLLVGSVDLSGPARDQIKEWIAGGDGLVGPELDNGSRAVVGRTWAQYVALMARAVQNVGQAVGDRARVIAIQKALRLKPDGVWGPVTDNALYRTWLIRKGGLAQFRRYNVALRKEMQVSWGAKPVDGIWGRITQAANVSAVKAVQKALGVYVDGIWGPQTDKAYRALRSRTLRK